MPPSRSRVSSVTFYCASSSFTKGSLRSVVFEGSAQKALVLTVKNSAVPRRIPNLIVK